MMKVHKNFVITDLVKTRKIVTRKNVKILIYLDSKQKFCFIAYYYLKKSGSKLCMKKVEEIIVILAVEAY